MTLELDGRGEAKKDATSRAVRSVEARVGLVQKVVRSECDKPITTLRSRGLITVAGCLCDVRVAIKC